MMVSKHHTIKIAAQASYAPGQRNALKRCGTGILEARATFSSGKDQAVGGAEVGDAGLSR